MKKVNKKKAFASATLALGMMIPLAVPAVSYAEVMDKDIVKLRIMETTDIHSHVMNYDYFQGKEDHKVGFVKTASLIKKAKEEAKNSVLIDNGDLIQGNPMADYILDKKVLDEKGKTHPVYEAMNLLGYDAGNLGNHEFNFGLEYLEQAKSGANFPYVNANVYKYDGDNDPTNDVNMYKPYIILDKEVVDEGGTKHTLKVGVIGFVPPQITLWDKKHLEGKVVTHDIFDTAKKFVPKMKEEGADVIIAVPHSGLGNVEYENLAENQTYQLSNVEGIDAILFGHAHSYFPGKGFDGIKGIDNKKGTINGVAAIMPGFWGNNLGVIDMDLKKVDGKWTVVDSQSTNRPIFDTAAGKPTVDVDKEILDAVHDDHEGTKEYVSAEVGKTETALYSYFSQIQDDPTIQIVTQSQKEYIEKYIKGTEYDGLPVLSAGAPLKAGRDGVTDYTDIAVGKLAIKDTSSLYKYPNNTIMGLKLTGAEIIEWLEWSAGQFNQIDPNSKEEQLLVKENKSAAPGFPSYNYDVIDGIEYQIDVTQPARYDNDGKKISDSKRIVNVMFNGKPIDLKQSFIVAANDYRASFSPVANPGGNKVVIKSPDTNLQVLVNYIREKGTVNPKADQNWSIAPIKGDVNLVFKSSPEAKKYANQSNNLKYLETLSDGLAKYKVELKAATAPTKSFSDVKEGYWAKQYIESLAGSGVISGKADGTFAPDEKISRGQFVALLVRTLGLSDGTVGLDKEIEIAYKNGLTANAPVHFEANKAITREQMAAMVVRAYEKKTGKAYVANKSVKYKDSKKIYKGFTASIDAAAELEFMIGNTSGRFEPKTTATRAQAAKVIYSFLNK
ncbi:bifunctional 2',3'-cyclic-nucleotide 2'-phosphodiesterase/3'-nucleotidase [Peribacillus acanthi]|uniref:bifunctional 2',3'-cyclic-nucleotide 2'-phosphodiesterase/3'-nucleotidase n=1 Tax=Peribacillus acanthi TaxID=2171554 RepID=UPI001F0C994F|nr:bifunctional 2',3'-cyclic-nucleotide 2'-phosphodiesterase/3'-nucleotidase [Peribacillus acanthi]